MRTLRKTGMAALAGLGALALVSAAAGAHGSGQGGPGYGMGMMMGPGMMGHGPGQTAPQYPGRGGHGMMGHGMMHKMMHGTAGPGFGQGMGPGFGQGTGQGFGPCGQGAAATGEDLDVDAVKARMERWLDARGNERLKLGTIEAVDDDTITVEIVTVDDSLVQKLAVDRHTGWTRPAE